MKKFISMTFAALILSTSTGCFGEFQLTRNLHQWNADVTESRFVNNLVFYGLGAIQVYSIASLADLFIFNLIEFWTGSNPVSMEEGDFDKQIIPLEGEDYIVEATKNQFKIYNENTEPVYLRFDESDASWNYVENGVSEKLVSIHQDEEGTEYHIYTEDAVVSLDADHDYSRAFLASIFSGSKALTAMK